MTGKLLTLDRTLELTLPAMLTLLDAHGDDALWRSLEPTERRQRTLDALTRWVLRVAREQPLLLIVEDLHWIDGETQALLDGLVDSLASARVLLVVTYRPVFPHDWGGKAHYTEIRVDVLGAAEAEELLGDLLGAGSGLDDLKRLLVQRTEGNPLFLEESVRNLAETKALAGAPGAYRLAKPISAIRIAPSVHALLAARIDRLSSDEKRLLQAAAVIGTDVPVVLLHQIADAPETDVRRGLAALQAAGFVHEAKLFPDLEYTFAHALTHEVAYGTLLQPQRRELHARIAEALERLRADRLAEHIEQLAYHAFRGELWDKATSYLRQAGIKAAGRSGYSEARGHFEDALGALAHLPDTRETKVQGIDLRLDARAALAPLGNTARSSIACAKPRRSRGRSAIDAGWGSWWRTSARLRNFGEHARALEASRQALDIARELEDADLAIEATYRLAQAHFAVGDLVEASALFRMWQSLSPTTAGLPRCRRFSPPGPEPGSPSRSRISADSQRPRCTRRTPSGSPSRRRTRTRWSSPMPRWEASASNGVTWGPPAARSNTASSCDRRGMPATPTSCRAWAMRMCCPGGCPRVFHSSRSRSGAKCG